MFCNDIIKKSKYVYMDKINYTHITEHAIFSTFSVLHGHRLSGESFHFYEMI